MENKAISLITGDITALQVDAIVNAANNSLLGGGGVDGAIHRAAGPKLLDACRAIGGCPTGEARITPGFNLPARCVIHTVGPVWRGGNHNEEALLHACYTQSLKLGLENQCFTIAFPNISTGIYGFPRQRAAEIAIGAVQDFISTNPARIKVIFVCFDNENFRIYRQLLGN
ncbi:MAG: O-acetyl-ADP-ribose deacetylase [Lentimicrobium sp.]|uniref:O-acetyl-ADP-ribose deacetylase n=1 Tax=Lentimicrobium sp. TaxID=2034841 RepID=UPI0025F691F5|nr:O-acetyl-ADP-ribose deacetylase [Lentimicrobium sp.]MCO5255646.1 O-acetyl-ADP-ribose deacetylase [Lentimicrobium sp.]